MWTVRGIWPFDVVSKRYIGPLMWSMECIIEHFSGQ